MKNAPTFEAVELTAYISLLLDEKPEAFLNDSDKVCFRFSKDVSKALDSFYGNNLVRVHDFTKAIKMVRSMIYEMRGGGHG